jgi:hypothetical protein
LWLADQRGPPTSLHRFGDEKFIVIRLL